LCVQERSDRAIRLVLQELVRWHRISLMHSLIRISHRPLHQSHMRWLYQVFTRAEYSGGVVLLLTSAGWYTLAASSSGSDVRGIGSNEQGQLSEELPELSSAWLTLPTLFGFKIVMVSCGNGHSLCLDGMHLACHGCLRCSSDWCFDSMQILARSMLGVITNMVNVVTAISARRSATLHVRQRSIR
jgi:hypothetical protein